MASDLLGISTSGLLVAQQQIGTTGHNIANVNTPGYARQNTTSVSRIPGFTGNGYVGTGVEVESTKRSYNEFLEELIRGSNSQLGKQEQFYNIAVQIDNVLGDPDAGLTPVLEDFYGALEEANDYPSSVATRSVLLTNAQSLVDRFDFLHDRLTDLNDQVNDKLKDVTNEVTSAAASLAELNAQIIYQIGSAAGSSSVPNDVLDQREELIKTISERIEANVVYQDNGAVNVFVGSGQALVLNTDAFRMELVDNEFTPRDQEIQLSNKNGSFIITEQIRGGELEGLVNVKNEILESGFNAMGRIAAGITKEMNEQHELGMTLQPNEGAEGGFNLGSNFFNNLDTLQEALQSENNSSNAVVSFKITDTNFLTISDYELEKIEDDGGNDKFRLKRLSDGLSISAVDDANETAIEKLNAILLGGDSATDFDLPQGFQFDEPLPALAVGDKFLVQPTHDLARKIRLEIDDVKDIALAAPIQVRELTDSLGVGQNTGTTSFEFVSFSPEVSSVLSDDELTDLGAIGTFGGRYISGFEPGVDSSFIDVNGNSITVPGNSDITIKDLNGNNIIRNGDVNKPIFIKDSNGNFLTYKDSIQVNYNDDGFGGGFVGSNGKTLLTLDDEDGNGKLDPIMFPLPVDVDSNGNEYSILLDQYDSEKNRFVMSGPGLAGLPNTYSYVYYDPETQSGTEISLGAPYEFMSFRISGVPDEKDSFYIGNNTTPQDDNRNGLVMAKIQTKKTLENGRADFQRAYSLAVADVGTRTHSSEVDMKAQQTINERAQQNRNSLSGVNLDEEASNLLRFQQSYSASAKVIGVADEVFNTLLQSV